MSMANYPHEVHEARAQVTPHSAFCFSRQKCLQTKSSSFLEHMLHFCPIFRAAFRSVGSKPNRPHLGSASNLSCSGLDEGNRAYQP